MEERSKFIIKFHAAQSYFFWHYLQPVTRNIRLAEFPKSGGTWLSQMLAEIFEIPFPRNKRLPFTKCIQHSHYVGPTNFKTLVLIRDGRDVMTSAYFHFLIYSDKKPRFLVDDWRLKVPSEDYNEVIKTMPGFIEKFNEHFKIGGRQITWSNHVMSYVNCRNVLFIKYEDLLRDPKNQLLNIAEWYHLNTEQTLDDIIERYSFKKQSKRVPGTEDATNFLRKGISGDWKNYLNDEALNVFYRYNQEGMHHFGYE